MEKSKLISSFEDLLETFNSLPKSNTDPTFMDICQMGGDRFEERCSQIIKFFLDPSAPHNLNGLFLTSLLDAIGKEEYSFNAKAIKVMTEEMTDDRKFIDITVVADEFVIAIENKIGAELYNPLGSYVAYIKETYASKPEHIFVLLSVRRITDEAEIRKLKQFGYIYINYQDLFKAIKRRLGNYVLDANQSYVTFLIDFIRTIENRYYANNMELKHFFYNKGNRETIDRLIYEYDRFKTYILNLQKEQIARLKIRISDRTSAKWWAYQGWDLGTTFNDDWHCLGIESSFGDSTIDNPLGNFHIYVTVWKKKDFKPYESLLKEAYPNCEIDDDAVGGTRVYLHLPIVDGQDSDAIVNALAKCYETVKEIASKARYGL